jgi:hypothetical protein
MSRTTPELDSIGQGLRDAFRRADLPAAPSHLRAEAEALSILRPASAGPVRISRWRRSTLIAAASLAAVIALVAVGLPLLLVQPQAGGHPSATASMSSPSATVSPSSTDATATPFAPIDVPSATPAVTPTPVDPSAVPTPLPSSIVSGTPRPGDQAMAVSIATKYQTYIKQGQWAKAWAMLSPEQRSGGLYDVYSTNWSQILASWHTLAFTLGTPSHDWQSWDANMPAHVAGNFGRAFIINVDYTFTGQTNFWNVLLILPTIDGTSWTVSEER